MFFLFLFFLNHPLCATRGEKHLCNYYHRHHYYCRLCVSSSRILFWTDWDATFPRIEAASMSGGGRHTVFKDMEIGAWPNGLTLDHLEKRIVWTDARYTISASQAVQRCY